MANLLVLKTVRQREVKKKEEIYFVLYKLCTERERERESYALSAFREVPGGRRYDGARVKKKRKNMLHKKRKGRSQKDGGHLGGSYVKVAFAG